MRRVSELASRASLTASLTSPSCKSSPRRRHHIGGACKVQRCSLTARAHPGGAAQLLAQRALCLHQRKDHCRTSPRRRSRRRSTAGLRSKKDTIVGFRCQRDPNPLRRTLKFNQNRIQHGMYSYLFSTANRGSAPPPLSKPHSKPLRRTRKFNQNRIPRRTLKFEKPRSCLLVVLLGHRHEELEIDYAR